MRKIYFNKTMLCLVIFSLFFLSLTPVQGSFGPYDVEDGKLNFKDIFSVGEIKNSINNANVIFGEKLDSTDYDLGYIESMDVSIARDKLIRDNSGINLKKDNIKHGSWVIPSKGGLCYPYSGQYNVINKWGDTMMGISFPYIVDIKGAWFAGQGEGKSAWTTGIRVLGYQNGEQVQTTDWFYDIDISPSWFEMNLENVDRIVIESIPVLNGGGWYGMDDLTFSPKNIDGSDEADTIIIDFEDGYYKLDLNKSNYADLTWETGTGSFYTNQIENSSEEYNSNPYNVNSVGTPTLINDFQGVIRGDAESWSYPPDTCGAAGPDHFVEVVNRNFAVYDKDTGEELINILLGAFLPDSNGDPRVLYDQYSERWFIIVCDFTSKIFLAVSTSDDPTDDWFKCSFTVSQGSDAGKWPDYPTLGVDKDGVYTAAYMIGGGNGMSIFALEKAPLIATNPSLGDIYAFRELPWEGAIQPVHTYGTTQGEYFVSRASSTEIRLRLLTGLLSNPVLTNICFFSVPYHSSPPDAPALGSSVPLDTVGHRLMNAVYRDGYIWTAHCINVNGRAASRWYKLDVSDVSLDDYGTIQDSEMYYYFPTIVVNDAGDAIMGFTGSSPDQYAAAYYTGRYASDPPGEMSSPILLKEGEASYNLIDGYGRNRWGDYSLCTLDPEKGTLWTAQEYAYLPNETGNNRWGTWIGEFSFNRPPDAPEINGPIGGAIGIEQDITFISADPENEDIFYYIDWGDGEIEDWIGPFPSDEEKIFSHIWSELGTYEIIAKAKDINNIEGLWSAPFFINISNPPNAPNINGQNKGSPDVSYEFGFSSIEPDGEEISEFIINWGDGNEDESIIGPFESGEEAKASHIWVVKGDFIISAKAKDIHGVVGPEVTMPINIPKNRFQFSSFWLRFSDIFLILQRLTRLIK